MHQPHRVPLHTLLTWSHEAPGSTNILASKLTPYSMHPAFSVDFTQNEPAFPWPGRHVTQNCSFSANQVMRRHRGRRWHLLDQDGTPLFSYMHLYNCPLDTTSASAVALPYTGKWVSPRFPYLVAGFQAIFSTLHSGSPPQRTVATTPIL